MSDNSYSLTTKKTWHQTMQELEDQMRLWGITKWETNYPRGARSEAQSQKEEDRTVRLVFNTVDGTHLILKTGPALPLSMNQ